MPWNCSRNNSAKVGAESLEEGYCPAVESEKVDQTARYCKSAIKVTIVLISFAGFLYQATDICAHYFSYRTVVFTNTEQDSVIDLPAVTFCLPTYFTKRALIDLYGVHISRSIRDAKRHFSNNHTLMSNMESLIYESFQRQAFKDLPANDILKKTIKSVNIVECRLFYPPLTWVNMTHSKVHEIIQFGVSCDELANQIESINANGKCFTYFGQMEYNDYNDNDIFKISANRGYRFHSGRFMQILVHFERDTYATLSNGHKRECLQVHPPHKVPSEACLHAISPGMSYDFVFTETKSILQPSPYQTDCHSYHGSAHPNDPKSRSDCIDKCIIQLYQIKCKCMPIHVAIWSNVTENLNISICNYDDYNSIAQCVEEELSNHCYETCKPDCVYRHFHLQVESSDFLGDANIQYSIGSERERFINIRKKTAVINIWSNYQSDVTYVHTPSMSFVQLVCYLGGLASLWLGVSVMTISGWLAHLFPYFQRCNRRQNNVLIHCEKQLTSVGHLSIVTELYSPQRIPPSVWCSHDNEDLPLFHRPSICSVSQLGTVKF